VGDAEDVADSDDRADEERRGEAQDAGEDEPRRRRTAALPPALSGKCRHLGDSEVTVGQLISCATAPSDL
jgi:hypothetical protein